MKPTSSHPSAASLARKVLALGALLALVGGLAHAYTIVLKDGSTLLAKEKYRLENGRAIIKLPSGTETFIDAAEIDVEATEQLNQDNLGTALLLEGGEVTALPATPQAKERDTLSDLIVSGKAGTGSSRPQARRPKRTPQETRSADTTLAGNLDLSALERKTYGNLDIQTELRTFFISQGLSAQVFQGTRSDRPLVEVGANSEAAVFRALAVASNALIQLKDRYPGQFARLELLLTTPSGGKAGQFEITPEMASDLLERRIELSAFYVANVQF